MMTIPSTGWPGAVDGGALRDRLEAVLPGEQAYDAARAAWNSAVDQRPAVVVHATSTRDVVATVRTAAERGLRVAVQATGHNAGPLGPLDDVVLLRTAGMTGVRIDPGTGRARVRAGTLWHDVVEQAARHGVAVRHGSSPDVGVVGYSLGGGIGWYARAHGLQCSQITGAQVVLADGSVLDVGEHDDGDGLWALRGGGGNLGVVTEMEFRTLPVRTAYAGMLAWDLDHAAEVLPAWLEWTRTAPDLASTSLRLLQVPPLPTLPPELRGRRLVTVLGALLTDDDAASALLAPLRRLAPEIDTWGRVAAPALARLSMDPEGPTPIVTGSALLAPLPSAAADRLLAVAGPGAGSTLAVVELVHLGGALSRPADGALDSVPGDLALLAVGMAFTPEAAARSRSDVDDVVGSLAPWATGGRYLNFTGDRVDPSSAYRPEAWARLQRVRASVDPGGLFRPNHEVPLPHG